MRPLRAVGRGEQLQRFVGRHAPAADEAGALDHLEPALLAVAVVAPAPGAGLREAAGVRHDVQAGNRVLELLERGVVRLPVGGDQHLLRADRPQRRLPVDDAVGPPARLRLAHQHVDAIGLGPLHRTDDRRGIAPVRAWQPRRFAGEDAAAAREARPFGRPRDRPAQPFVREIAGRRIAHAVAVDHGHHRAVVDRGTHRLRGVLAHADRIGALLHRSQGTVVRGRREAAEALGEGVGIEGHRCKRAAGRRARG